MKRKVLPHSTSIVLAEDQDQGEMDTVFFLSVISYSIYLCFVDILYPLEKDKIAIGKLHLVMSNMFAFYPVMQAQGLWLKLILIMTVYYSILWHWTETGLYLPGDPIVYGKWDAIFSVVSIVTYCLSWLPRLKTKMPTKEEEKRSCWYHNCRGRPKETSEWRCRWTPNLIINILVGVSSGVFIYFLEDGYFYQILFCFMSIFIATISALYQLLRGEMVVGKKFRKNFLFWAVVGVGFGFTGFIYKIKANANDENRFFFHSVWHMGVMSSAYSFSRAAEYLEIYTN